MEDELGIWRYQEYVEHPALAKEDARPYRPMRKWAKQFDETEAREDVTTHGERRAMRS
jgi:3-ketosteroid 9alpha-monooxygenase subunit A